MSSNCRWPKRWLYRLSPWAAVCHTTIVLLLLTAELLILTLSIIAVLRAEELTERSALERDLGEAQEFGVELRKLLERLSRKIGQFRDKAIAGK